MKGIRASGRANRHRRRRRTCRALTLAEVSASLLVCAVVLGGLASTVVVASRALPERNTETDGVLRSVWALDRLSEEVHCASEFVLRGERGVEFTIPDRTGDDAPEVVRYEWSGVAGEPLTRRINGGAAAAVSPPLKTLAFGYDVETRTTTEKSVSYLDSTETLLAQFSTFGALATTTNLPVNTTAWAAETFSALTAVPSDAVQLQITRVSVTMRRPSTITAGASVSAGIHGADLVSYTIDPNPIGTPSSRLASMLGTSYATVTFTFSDVVVTNPLAGLAVVFKGTGAATAQVQKQNLALAAPNGTAAMWTTTAGSTWLPARSEIHEHDIPFAVYGTYRTRIVTDVEVTRYFLKRVRVAAEFADGRLPLALAASVVAEPEVGEP